MHSQEAYILKNSEDIKRMFTIRKFENTLLDLFAQGTIGGTCHTCMGQEYIPVSLAPFIKESDFVISNHRGHGHYLARYDDVEGILAEIMGKEGAICNGIGGSQHLYRDRFISTGVQAEGVAVATGIAWAMKQQKLEEMVFAYVGDGTFGRGCLYESLNFAGLWDLPIVIIVENNGIALSTHMKDSMSGSIQGRIEGFGLDYVCIEDTNVEKIREKIGNRIEIVRQKSVPLVIEFKTIRAAAHSKGDDTRNKKELADVENNYWYNKLKKEQSAQLERLENEVNQQFEEIIQRVCSRGEAVWKDYEERTH